MGRPSLAAFSAVLFATFAALSFSLTAARAQGEHAWLHAYDARGRSVSLGQFRGQVVALTFVGRGTRDVATDINDELSSRAQPGRMTVLSVVDLEDIPSFGRHTALDKIADSDRPGLTHVVDGAGKLSQSFHVDPKHRVTIFVVDKEGVVRGRFEDEAGLPAALRLIEQLNG
jgi:hypothetical protein